MRQYVDGRTGNIMTSSEATIRICERWLDEWVKCEETYRRTADIGEDAEKQIRRWLWGFDIPYHLLLESVNIAFDRNPDDVYQYFCGVVWTKIRSAAQAGWDE